MSKNNNQNLPKEEKLFVFILMPFKDSLTQIYERYIKRPLESKGYIVKRADDLYASTPILSDILDCIKKANIIIAELTERNPNVFYELGRAHEMEDKYVIQICQENEVLAFDLRHIRTIIYKDSLEGYEELEKKILKFINTYLEEIYSKPKIKKIRIKKTQGTIDEQKKLRKFIESIKASEKQELSDLIVLLPFNDLVQITKMIIGEITLIENYEEYKSKIPVFDFIIYSVIIREIENEKIILFSFLLEILKSGQILYDTRFYEKFQELLRIECIRNYIIEYNLKDDLIDIYTSSGSYTDAGIKARILLTFKGEYSQSQIIKIAHASIKNDQIFGSGKGSRYTFELLVEQSSLIPKDLFYILEEKKIWPKEI